MVLSGKIEVTKRFDGIERTIGWRVAGKIFGEVPIALGGPFIGSYRASEPSRVVRVEARQYYALAARWPEIAESVGALRENASVDFKVSPQKRPKRGDDSGAPLRRRLPRTAPLPRPQPAIVRLGDTRGLEIARAMAGPCPADDGLPALLLADGTMLTRPEPRQVGMHLGLQTRGRLAEYDTIIVGGGPAGLAAAVYAASEGLRTLVVEREAPGGQAGTSSRIENYLGFPNGVSGDELAIRALQQAKRLGAEILVTRNIARIDPAAHIVDLDDGEVLRGRTIILATGVASPSCDRRLRRVHRQGHLLRRCAERGEQYAGRGRIPHWRRQFRRPGGAVLFKLCTQRHASRSRRCAGKEHVALFDRASALEIEHNGAPRHRSCRRLRPWEPRGDRCG